MALAIQASSYPSRNFAALAESESVILPPTIRGVYCLTDGNLVVDNWSDVTSTIPMVAGRTVAISPKRLRTASTGTYLALK